MLKRKRAASEECRLPPPSAPLTAANLGRLQQALTPAVAMASGTRPTSPSRRDTSTTTFDDGAKLQCYCIEVDGECPLPDTLQRHVDDVRRPRDPLAAPSPNAKRQLRRLRIAQRRAGCRLRSPLHPGAGRHAQ
jgi:hypothetical protein